MGFRVSETFQIEEKKKQLNGGKLLPRNGSLEWNCSV